MALGRGAGPRPAAGSAHAHRRLPTLEDAPESFAGKLQRFGVGDGANGTIETPPLTYDRGPTRDAAERHGPPTPQAPGTRRA